MVLSLLFFEFILVHSQSISIIVAIFNIASFWIATSIDHLVLNDTRCTSTRQNSEAYCTSPRRRSKSYQKISSDISFSNLARRSSLRKMLVNKENAHQFLHSIYRTKRFSFRSSSDHSNKKHHIHPNRRSSKQKSWTSDYHIELNPKKLLLKNKTNLSRKQRRRKTKTNQQIIKHYSSCSMWRTPTRSLSQIYITRKNVSAVIC